MQISHSLVVRAPAWADGETSPAAAAFKGESAPQGFSLASRPTSRALPWVDAAVRHPCGAGVATSVVIGGGALASRLGIGLSAALASATFAANWIRFRKSDTRASPMELGLTILAAWLALGGVWLHNGAPIPVAATGGFVLAVLLGAQVASERPRYRRESWLGVLWHGLRRSTRREPDDPG